mmetsp:Transcript_69073/g.133335  ORF Transcript_69073/g.133335 Transcript_69073/m.133335 type:complete len:122 (+) Transcript_69073:768-1133(+)
MDCSLESSSNRCSSSLSGSMLDHGNLCPRTAPTLCRSLLQELNCCGHGCPMVKASVLAAVMGVEMVLAMGWDWGYEQDLRWWCCETPPLLLSSGNSNRAHSIRCMTQAQRSLQRCPTPGHH